jgi:hypothetical protein
MNRWILGFISFGALAALHSPGAFAQGLWPGNGGMQGTTELDAAAVTSVTENTSSQLITLGLRLTNGQFAVISYQYTLPFTGGITFQPWSPFSTGPLLDSTVAHLIQNLATAKMNDTSGSFGTFALTNINYSSFSLFYRGRLFTNTTYAFSTATEATLNVSTVAQVPGGQGGSNTLGGLTQAVIFAGGTRSVENNTLQCYGRIRLQRLDSGVPFIFDCFMLQAGANIMLPDGTFQAADPISPSLDPNFNVNTLLSDVLAGPPHQILFERVPLPAIKLNDTRVIVLGNSWTNTF